MSEEIVIGSVSVSARAHGLLTSLVFDKEKASEDRPFTAIVEAFRFAFALGYSKGERKEREEGETVTSNIAPRQFVVKEYEVILRDTCLKESVSLGALSSEYAEAGCEIITKHIDSGGTVLGLV